MLLLLIARAATTTTTLSQATGFSLLAYWLFAAAATLSLYEAMLYEQRLNSFIDMRVLVDRYRYLLLGLGVALIFGYWSYQAMRGQ